MKILRKLITIVRAKLRDKNKMEEKKWYKERLAICAVCPLNSKNKEKKTARWYLLSFLNLRNDFCTHCGCELKAKASEELEMCPQGKWKQEIIE